MGPRVASVRSNLDFLSLEENNQERIKLFQFWLSDNSRDSQLTKPVVYSAVFTSTCH